MTTIRTTCTVGKSLAIKLVKDGDDESVLASLSFVDATITRDEADHVLGVEAGWSERLFDSLGAPAFDGSLDLGGVVLDCTAVIGDRAHNLTIRAGAELSKVSLTLQPNGFLLSGSFAWKVAGDESADAEPLIGRLCNLVLTIERPQSDLLRPAA